MADRPYRRVARRSAPVSFALGRCSRGRGEHCLAPRLARRSGPEVREASGAPKLKRPCITSSPTSQTTTRQQPDGCCRASSRPLSRREPILRSDAWAALSARGRSSPTRTTSSFTTCCRRSLRCWTWFTPVGNTPDPLSAAPRPQHRRNAAKRTPRIADTSATTSTSRVRHCGRRHLVAVEAVTLPNSIDAYVKHPLVSENLMP